MSLREGSFLTQGENIYRFSLENLTSLHGCPIIKTSKGKSKADNPLAEIAVSRAADMRLLKKEGESDGLA